MNKEILKVLELVRDPKIPYNNIREVLYLFFCIPIKLKYIFQLSNTSMFYFYNVFKCIVTIYMFNEVSGVFARHKTHSTKYKIDEFIDKLLASKKFDVLAEKFAQKAVDKMINIKPNLRLTKDFETEMNAPQDTAFKNVSYKTDVHFEETLSPVKNLSLKYKYFTKAAFYDIRSEENNETKVKEPKISSTNNLTVTERNSEANDDADESINISDLESSLHDKPENTHASLKHNGHENSSKISGRNKTMKQEDGSLSAENKRNAEFLSENELAENHKINKNDVKEVVSDFDKKVRKDRALFSNESTEAAKIHELKKPRSKRIHREGNRLYTFQSSSDYEEYHQELERVEKKRKVFV